MAKGIRQTTSELREQSAALEARLAALEALSLQAEGIEKRFKALEEKEKEVTALITAATAKANTATEIYDGLTEQKVQIDAVAAIADSLKKEVADGMTALDGATTSFDEAANKYNEFLTEKKSEITLTLKKIDDLLRGATSVGLGTSFEKRRKTYMLPRIGWLIGASIAIATIITVSILNGDNILRVISWDAFWLAIMRKLPVITPSIFVAYYAFHQYGILSRLEEEYAHKTVMSWAFEGYRTELLKNESTKAKLDDLVADVLNAIKQPSARIYDTSTRPVTPIDGSAEKIIDAMKHFSGKGEEPVPMAAKIAKLPLAITSVITALGVSVLWLIAKLVTK